MKLNRLLTGTLIVCLAISTEVQGQASKTGTTASFAASLTDGNSDTLNANASIVTTGEKEGLGSYRAGVEGSYGENTVRTETTTDGRTTVTEKDETTVENAKAFANVKKTLTEKTFAYVDGSLLYDDVAKIDYRGIVGPGLGVYLLKDDISALSMEAGVAYVWEDVADVEDDYAALRLAQRFDYKLSDNAKIWEGVEYLPQLNDFDNYLLVGEIGIEAAVNATLSLRLALQDRYDSQPGAGLEKNDLAFIAGIAVKL